MSDDYAVPRDVWAERATVGGLLAAGTVPEDLGVTHEAWWDPQLRHVAHACLDLTAAGRPCDPITVRTDLLRRGVRGLASDGTYLAELMRDGCPAGSLTHHAKTLRDLQVRRDVMEVATRALQQAVSPTSDPYDVAAHLHVEAGILSDSGDPTRPERTTDIATFLEGDDAYDWLVPGLFERGDRFLISGHEGSGKSVIGRQLAVTTAAGCHAFTGHRITPCRVLLVDLENGPRHLRRALAGLHAHAIASGYPIDPAMLTIETKPSGIDLTRIEDATWLQRLCDTVRPELLVIGPLYRMHAADMNAEEPARQLTRVIDRIRAEHNCVVIMETHAGHGASGQTRALRPVGSSLFMRWPEFGYGLRPRDADEAVMELVPWRGPRDERDFPRYLCRGGANNWPWIPFRGPQVQWSEGA